MGNTDTASRVEFGDVAFDPVTTQDFRLSVEGTSGTGKSNTLAVLLEDLAEVSIPTLVIERLGALTPARLVDEDLVVVGAREEEGVDLAVALADLDQLGAWVLDRGMKIVLDISTYADYEDEKSRVHLAAAKALRSLNDRAHEKYRAGDRTKSLLVVDEAHILAPKDSAPEPELDEWVKRCRGQLIKASTEGGNKGISVVVGYQRRAFLHNGVIQLAQDFVAHKPGDEDINRTADALRCSEATLAGLGTGEIVARGESITDGEVVGPTRVRKRTSPDPREETFELPETPAELTDVLDELQAEVTAEQERRAEREDELERLREENERLRDRVDGLEQELADTDRLASALENLGSNGGGAAQDVGEGVADLRERVDELKAERDAALEDVEAAEAEADALRDERDALEEQIADLEADVQELRSAFEQAADAVETLGAVFETDVNIPTDTPAVDDADGDVTALRERVAELEAENDRLRERDSTDALQPLNDYEAFLDDDAVREAIDEAKQVDRTSPRYIKGVIASIVDAGGPVPYDDIAQRLDLSSTTHVSKAASVLEARQVIEKENRADGMYVDLNTDGLNEVREAAARRDKTEQLMEEL
ncbi:MAG: hypothetical protein ACOCZD_02490 [Haloferacaceae archaeon]